MKLKTFIKYNLKLNIKNLIWFYAIIMGITLFMPILFGILSEDTINVQSSHRFSLYITIMIIAMALSKENLNFGVQNGVSRKSQHIAFVLSMLITSLITAILNIIFDKIFILVENVSGGAFKYSDIIRLIYAERTVFTGAVSGALVTTLWDIAMIMFFSLLGYFIISLFYPFSNSGRVILGLGIGAFIVLLQTIDYRLLDNRLSTGFGNFFMKYIAGGETHNPMYAVVTMLTFSLILFVISWPLKRIAKAKV